MIRTFKLVFLLVFFWSCDEKTKPQKPPNIIVIVTDDQRWDAIGYAGNEIIVTHEQDQLAKEGTYFNKAFVTTPICGASRATIITGLYERKHKFTLGGTILDQIVKINLLQDKALAWRDSFHCRLLSHTKDDTHVAKCDPWLVHVMRNLFTVHVIVLAYHD